MTGVRGTPSIEGRPALGHATAEMMTGLVTFSTLGLVYFFMAASFGSSATGCGRCRGYEAAVVSWWYDGHVTAA